MDKWIRISDDIGREVALNKKYISSVMSLSVGKTKITMTNSEVILTEDSFEDVVSQLDTALEK